MTDMLRVGMLTPSSNTILEPMTQRMLRDLSILVTHDQEEAMSIADHIIVMNKGKIVQQGDAESLYNSPRTRFVGEFLGQMNWFEGEFGEHNDVGCRNFRTDDGLDVLVNQDLPPSSSPQIVGVRPERMTLSDQSAASMANSFSGTVFHVEYLGAVMELWIKLPSGRIISVIDPNLGHPVAAIGSAVTVSFAPADCIIVADDAGTE